MVRIEGRGVEGHGVEGHGAEDTEPLQCRFRADAGNAVGYLVRGPALVASAPDRTGNHGQRPLPLKRGSGAKTTFTGQRDEDRESLLCRPVLVSHGDTSPRRGLAAQGRPGQPQAAAAGCCQRRGH